MNLIESLKEISEYLNKDFDYVLNEYNNVKEKYPGFVKWSHLSAEEWNQKKIDQSNMQEVMEFYRKTPNYIFELMEYHSTESKRKLSNTVIELCKRENIKTILDFGAGICQDSIIGSKSGFDVTAADIPGKTFEFGQWRIRKHKAAVQILEIHDETPLKEKYDGITCFEVLQHVIDPEKTLNHLNQHLHSSGTLFITTRFKNNYSLALKNNERYEEELEDLVKRCRFNIKLKKHMWGQNEKTKFLYVLNKQ